MGAAMLKGPVENTDYWGDFKHQGGEPSLMLYWVVPSLYARDSTGDMNMGVQ